MIQVTRPADPPGLAAAAEKELKAYEAFVAGWAAAQAPAEPRAPSSARPKRKGKSGGFEFNAFRSDAVRQTLEAAFHRKCAYCEADYSVVGNVRVEHFRPKGRVDRKGMKPCGGYFWLAGAWSNLLASCERCNSPKKDFVPALNRKVTVGKANWFPLLDESKRATGPGGEKDESPLLLNPCEEDPAPFLAFDENGMVEAAAALAAPDRLRAEESILVYGLGRELLVKARREYATRILGQIRHLEESYADWREFPQADRRWRERLLREWDDLARFQLPDAPFLALANQLIAQRVPAAMRQEIEGLRNAEGAEPSSG